MIPDTRDRIPDILGDRQPNMLGALPNRSRSSCRRTHNYGIICVHFHCCFDIASAVVVEQKWEQFLNDQNSF